jgi:signal transduction histidine kinase
VEYINTYVDGWRNYGNNCFDLSIVNDLIEAPLITFDRDMLTVMLDSVLNNAARHGFNKRKVNGNNVLLRLSIVEHESRPHLLISIANNGDAMADGFTINDYISRGRYTTSTGRSGLGGYHIYQIIKGHGGFLCLDSNKQWSVIVDILLPIDSVNTNDITTYEHECI